MIRLPPRPPIAASRQTFYAALYVDASGELRGFGQRLEQMLSGRGDDSAAAATAGAVEDVEER